MMHVIRSMSSRLVRKQLSNAIHSDHIATTHFSQPVRTLQHARRPTNGQRSTPIPHVRRAYASSSNPWPPPVRPPVRPPSATAKPKLRPASDGYTRFSQQSSSWRISPLTRYVIYASVGGIGIYVYSIVDYAPFTGRVRLLGISRESEMELGRRAFQDLLQSFGAERLLPARDAATQRVRRVVTRLARTANELDPHLVEGFGWAVVVADVPEPNAMCVPGGRILVTTGLLDILQSDDDIAIIVGHEIAHALNRHGVESMSLQRLLWPLVMMVNQVLDMRMLPSLFVTLLLSLPYGRKLEYEADTVGLMLCTEACYDPRVAPGVFQRLAQLQGENERPGKGPAAVDRLGSFFSTHPQTDERAKRLEAQLSERMRVYNDKCVHGHAFSKRMSRDLSRL